MPNDGWRTVIIENACELSFSQNCLNIAHDGEKTDIPIEQIRVLMVESLYVQLSSFLINELLRQNVKIIFCDEQHQPSCEIVPYCGNGHRIK